MKGIDINNPGNIQKSDATWEGQSPDQNDSRRVEFTAAIYGIRALARTLIVYQRNHGCDTVSKIIGRYAPTSENPTENYIRYICSKTQLDRDQIIDVTAYEVADPLIKAIISFENGQQPYTDAQI